MNEITTFKPEINPYMLALKDKRICELPEKPAKIHVAAVVTRCLNDLSHKMNGDDFKLFCDNAYQEIRLVFPQCTQAEFQMLCFNGIRGYYGETVGMSVVNLHKWIKGFLNSEQRIKAKKEMKVLESKEEKVDEAKIRKEYIETIRKQFENYKSTGALKLTFAGVLYDEFVSQGLINLSAEARKVLFKQAKARLIEQKKAARLKVVGLVQRMEIVKVLDRLQSDMENKSDNAMIIIESKTMAIKMYYDSIKAFPKTFK